MSNATPATRNGNPIGVFDSGIGGLSVANAVSGLLPREPLLYVADNAYAPYGPRPATEILDRSHLITRHLLARGAKLILVACNTATSVAIDSLRERYPDVPFVGLEPAVKPASKAASVGVLATRATLDSDRYRILRDEYFGDRPVLENPCTGLVPLIEAEGPGGPTLRKKLAEILVPMLREGIDTLVLGCTHYPLVKDDIVEVCGTGVRLIDPSPAAARQVARLLEVHQLAHPASTTPPRTSGRAHEFLTTGNSLPLQRSLLGLPVLNAGRRLIVPQYNFR